jgi:hypothetical protein
MTACRHAVRISEEIQTLRESTGVLKVSAYYEGPDHCALQNLLLHCRLLNVGLDSSVGIVVTSYGLDDPEIESRLGVRFSAPFQTSPGSHPASCKMGTGSFPGVKRPGRGVDHPYPSSAEAKERVELYLYSTSAPSLPVIG